MLESYHMRIGIDYRLANRHLGGMAVYLKSLLESLKRIDGKNKYMLFDDNPSAGPGFQKHIWTFVWEHLWLQLLLPYHLWKAKINLAYFPNPPVSFFLTTPVVPTIPDVSFMYDASLAGWVKWYLWTMYFLSAHKARKITTFSQSSKNDIVNFFKVPRAKIQVTPLAASRELSLQKVRRKDYIISVPGTFVSRKNVQETILAFKNLPSDLRTSHYLVIVGYAEGEDFNQLKDFVTSQNLTQSVIFTGRVTDQELGSLYSRAKLFVCTSRYEGFGLPILEAMACGTPVISYNNSSLPEVIGQAGILVNNVAELSQAMKEVLENKKLQTKLQQQGLKHASTFSWQKTANAFLDSLPKNVN